jgi:hypothetical protein
MSDTQLDHQLADLHLAAIREQYQPIWLTRNTSAEPETGDDGVSRKPNSPS